LYEVVDVAGIIYECVTKELLITICAVAFFTYMYRKRRKNAGKNAGKNEPTTNIILLLIILGI